jgi:hypothetical protein
MRTGKILALFLVLCMIFAMTACGSTEKPEESVTSAEQAVAETIEEAAEETAEEIVGESAAEATEEPAEETEKSIVGKWKGIYEAGDTFVESVDESVMAEYPEVTVSLGDYLSSLPLELYLTLGEDGNYSVLLTLPESEYDGLVESVEGYYRAVFNEMAGRELDDATLESALGMPLHEYAVYYTDQIVDAFESGSNRTGTYTIEDGRIVYEDGSYERYVLVDDALTVFADPIGPIIFSRVG